VPDRSRPVSTYRLQLTAGFGFAEAAAIAGYLAGLGVTHAYLSPILQAAPGSAHGYDVVDHSRISAELGGEAGFRAMAAEFRAHGLGLVVDVVPNHMAIPVPETLNQQLWSVLAEGPASACAHWFDVDWDAGGGRFLLPVLAGPVRDCLPDLRVQRKSFRGPLLRYFDHAFPVREGTADLPLPDLVDAQHYRLAHWRDAATELNWRRFFDITSLIGVRVEDPGVFTATHRLLLDLVAEGLIGGLRVDHPDGLADPRGYLRRLAEATGGAWVVTEKVLAAGEELPPDWTCAGTTGYDALAAVGGLFVDPAAAPALAKAYLDFTGQCCRGGTTPASRHSPPQQTSFAEVAHEARRQQARHTFGGEVSRLARLAAAAGGAALAGVSAGDLRTVLVELLAGFGVYRAYVVPGEPPSQTAVAAVDAAAGAAREHLPPRLHQVLAALRDLALGLQAPAWEGEARGASPPVGGSAGGLHPAWAFIVAFGQTSGPVMAKGVEDTAFYRWSRLVALNEVGGDPGRFGASPEEFHAFAARLAEDWPATMTTLSTHDTKRQEDVRARLAVLAEMPREWASEVTRWHERAAALAGGRCPEPDTEYLLWQTLVGAWPARPQRVTEYLLKAAREAKTATSWTDPDPGYEEAALAFADLVLADATLAGWIAALVAGLASAARANSLGAKLVQLTMPGAADTYQGCELAGFSLVDPDNRRPVDYGRRRRLLDALVGGTPPTHPPVSPSPAVPDGLDAGKLLVAAVALRLRRKHPDWFAGAYQPLPADGPAARHAVAFVRGGHAVTVVTRLPVRLAAAGGWAGTVLPLPEVPGARGWRDVLTSSIHNATAPALSDITARYPVALLVPEVREAAT
jgi:(1->4)-alpha-D-glucan 1-alpha-D-glucosylmutase